MMHNHHFSLLVCCIAAATWSLLITPVQTLVHLRSISSPLRSSARRRTLSDNRLLLRATQDNDEISAIRDNDEEFMNILINGIPSADVATKTTSPPNFNGYSMTSGYSRFLDKNRDDLDEDGYADMMKRGVHRSFWKKLARLPVMAAKKVLSRGKTTEPGTLILVRHGESTWNRNRTFTGWSDDADLTEQGRREMQHAARLLMERGYEIDVVFTSRLKRAIRSTWILLQELNEVYLPVFKSWRLNERHYGSLTGLSKTQTAERLGAELVQEWRGSLRSRPPPLTESHPYYPGRDRKYADLTKNQIPLTESLADCMERTIPVWENKIKYELAEGRNVLVVAHANTLRGLVKTIDNIGDAEIQDVAIPTGIPIVYKFDRESNGDLTPCPTSKEENAVSQVHMNGKFLEKPGLLKEALKREEEWSRTVPGYDSTMSRHPRPMTNLERSLYKLNAERELGKIAGELIDWDALEDDGNDGNFGKPIALTEDEVWAIGMEELENGVQFDPDSPVFHTAKNVTIVSSGFEKRKQTVSDSFSANLSDDDADEDDDDDDDNTEIVPNFFAQPCVTAMPPSGVFGTGVPPSTRLDSVIVIIRHGKTQHNKLGLFTGWEDAPLADEGIEEAKEAGRLLKLHGFEFDVVYTSWLERALETALYVIDEMDSLWLPIVKTWRLNERMYGELTGLSKQMVKQRHGEKQFKAWRRGYNVKPPPVSSFSVHYPGNDVRYQKYLRDLRYSFKESVIRSIEKGKIVLQRKLPKTESLKDCMDRTIPYFVERIAQDAVDQKKRVLISSSENAIRGLLMHLCDIPETEITGLEIPNGLPLIYDVRSKCVKLLDDGSGRDPLEVYNFGDAAKYLFRPCQNEDGSLDEECTINFSGITLSSEDQATIDLIKGKASKPMPLSSS